MAKGTTNRRKRRGSFLTTIAGITLVLTVLGGLGFILLNFKQVDTYAKELIEIKVFLRDSANDTEIAKFQKSIDAAISTSSTKYVSKEQAAAQMTAELGDDFINNIGHNPLPGLIVLGLKAEYMQPDSVLGIVQHIESSSYVKEIKYRPDVIELVSNNMRKIALVLLAIAAVMLLIAFALINNTIRLAMYSKRFLIRSMQLVGATRGFIQRPFLWQGIVQGLISGIIAMGLILGMAYVLRDYVPAGFNVLDRMMLLKLFAATVGIGIFIAFFSTMFAVNKYIGMKLDDLY